MGHGLLDDSDGSAHPKPVLRNAGGILVRDGAFGWTELIGDVYETPPTFLSVQKLAAQVVVEVEMQAEELLHGI